MPRVKKNKEEGQTKMYSFGVDANDPKYKKLVDMLEGIDSGARSFIIRQILNHYVNSQTASPLFGLVVGANGPETQPAPAPIPATVSPVAATPTPAQPVYQTVATTKEETVHEKPQTHQVSHTPEDTTSPEPAKQKKNLPAGLKGLKNTFS